MPARPVDDPGIDVLRLPDERVRLTIGTAQIEMSEFNAVRAVAILSLMLGVPMSKQAKRGIKL